MALEGYKSNNNVVYSSKYHVVWTPKYRRPVLVDAIAKRCEQLIRQIAAKYNAEVIALEIMPDHVHLYAKSILSSVSAGEEHEGRKFAFAWQRIFSFAVASAYFVDQQLLRFHRGWSSACSH